MGWAFFVVHGDVVYRNSVTGNIGSARSFAARKFVFAAEVGCAFAVIISYMVVGCSIAGDIGFGAVHASEVHYEIHDLGFAGLTGGLAAHSSRNAVQLVSFLPFQVGAGEFSGCHNTSFLRSPKGNRVREIVLQRHTRINANKLDDF